MSDGWKEMKGKEEDHGVDVVITFCEEKVHSEGQSKRERGDGTGDGRRGQMLMGDAEKQWKERGRSLMRSTGEMECER
eukprot:765376-Hanusia_phi.AAC.3